MGTIVMELSKAYDCLPHDLLITELEAYCVCVSSYFISKKNLNTCFYIHEIKEANQIQKYLQYVEIMTNLNN